MNRKRKKRLTIILLIAIILLVVLPRLIPHRNSWSPTPSVHPSVGV